MKKRKNIAAKIMAIIALVAIVIGIIGTGVLVIVNSLSQTPQVWQEISQEDLQKYVDSLSWSLTIWGEE